MSTLQIKVKKQVEQESTLEMPAYFRRKDGTKFLAVIDQCEVIDLFILSDYISIRLMNADDAKSNIVEAVNEWDPCDEHTFRMEHEKAVRLISLPRKEITTDGLNERFQ